MRACNQVRIERALRRVNEERWPPFRVSNLFNVETFDGPHWAMAFRTLLGSRLIRNCGRRWRRLGRRTRQSSKSRPRFRLANHPKYRILGNPWGNTCCKNRRRNSAPVRPFGPVNHRWKVVLAAEESPNRHDGTRSKKGGKVHNLLFGLEASPLRSHQGEQVEVLTAYRKLEQAASTIRNPQYSLSEAFVESCSRKRRGDVSGLPRPVR